MSTEKSKLTPQQAAEILNTIKRGDAIFCLAKCWPCQFGQHSDEPHTWMDDDDREHAGLPKPTTQEYAAFVAKHPCGCWCNEAHR